MVAITGSRKAALKAVHRNRELRAGLLDVLLRLSDGVRHPEALSVRTSLSRWSDLAVRVGASDVFDMVLRP